MSLIKLIIPLRHYPLRSKRKFYKLVHLKQLHRFDHVFKWKGFCCPHRGVLKKRYKNNFEYKKYGDDEVIIDHSSRLMWQKSGSGEHHPGYIENNINKINQKKYAGFSDWRLPSLEEAISLLEPKRNNLKLFLNPIFSDNPIKIWTNDYVADKTRLLGAYQYTYNWFIDFNEGDYFSPSHGEGCPDFASIKAVRFNKL